LEGGFFDLREVSNKSLHYTSPGPGPGPGPIAWQATIKIMVNALSQSEALLSYMSLNYQSTVRHSQLAKKRSIETMQQLTFGSILLNIRQFCPNCFI